MFVFLWKGVLVRWGHSCSEFLSSSRWRDFLVVYHFINVRRFALRRF